MKFTVDEFRAWENKCVTLLGMSGVGKTYLSTLLRRNDWFHYSGDYRIGTRYLDEHILDLIKAQAMQVSFLKQLLRQDWIFIRNNIKVDDLGPVLSFVGKLGNPELSGLPLGEFNRRQALYREAEIKAMMDLPKFVHKAQEIYGYSKLVNDVGGSLCELDEPKVIDLLARHSLILYIRVPAEDEIKLIERAQADPKPLYYRPEFLASAVKDYLELRRLEFVAEIDPDDFTRWVFPRLFNSRVPRYEAIARPHGYTVSSTEVAQVGDEHDFLDLLEQAIARKVEGIVMPIVAHTNLPTFEFLRKEGQNILAPTRALQQDIRELHIGLLNMMPDAALAATERQFLRLINESNQIAQFYVHPFTLDELERSPEAKRHIERYYESFAIIREEGLDALIITGANVSHPNLADEPFWGPLIEVIDWASQNVTSTLCSCLATHAVLQFRYGQCRRPLPAKRWGVYPHRVIDNSHPLVNDVNTMFDVPHSRFNEISRDQLDAAGLGVLAESEEAGVHLAVSEDGFRIVFFQGHPEYDTISLLKEYKREVGRFIAGRRDDYPPFPEHYIRVKDRAILEEHRDRVLCALDQGREPPQLPEGKIATGLDNTWHDTAEGVVGNWMGKIYQLTNSDRRLPFMEGVNPNDPLGLYRP